MKPRLLIVIMAATVAVSWLVPGGPAEAKPVDASRKVASSEGRDRSEANPDRTGEESDNEAVLDMDEDVLGDSEHDADDNAGDDGEEAKHKADQANSRDEPDGAARTLPAVRESKRSRSGAGDASIRRSRHADDDGADDDGADDDGADDDDADDDDDQSSRALRIAGYLQPKLQVMFREDARPRDRWSYGGGDSRAGVVLYGEPARRWRYVFHVLVGAELLSAVTDVEPVDRNGDGVAEDVATSSSGVPGVFVEEATVAYLPDRSVEIKAGQMRIPFTVQHQSPNTALLFPERSGPNEAFLSGTDAGLQASWGPGSQATGMFANRLQAKVGVFGGSNASAATGISGREQGPVLALRLDTSPLGTFPMAERAVLLGPLRVGIGGGLLYRPGVRFDDGGFIEAKLQDLLLSGSLRVSGGGFHLQTEVMRRSQTDSVSDRAARTTGAYVQASQVLPFRDPVAVEPLGRVGWTERDQDFDPRTTWWVDAGLSIYFHPTERTPGRLKLILQYVGEYRVTEGEKAHGALSQLQMSF
jgi:hypothetical protein